MPRVDLISANIAPKVGLTIIEVFIGTRQTLRHVFIMSYRLFPLEGYTRLLSNCIDLSSMHT